MSFAAILLTELDTLLSPAIAAAQEPQQPERFLDFLGEAYVDGEVVFEAQSLTGAIRALAGTATALQGAIGALGGNNVGPAEVAAAARAVKQTVAAIKALRDVAVQPDIPPGFAAETGERVLEHLVGIYFADYQPRIAAVLQALGLLDAPDAEAGHSWRLHPETLATWVRDPEQAQRDVIGWGTAEFDQRLWVARFAALADSLGVPVETDTDVLGYLDPMLTQIDPIPPSLTASLMLVSVANASESGFLMARLEGLPATTVGDDGGFGLGILGTLAGAASYPVGTAYTMRIELDGELGADTFVSFRPGVAKVVGPGAPAAVRLTMDAEPTVSKPPEPLSAGLVTLKPGQPSLHLALAAGPDGAEADLRFGFHGSEVMLSIADADGFISQLVAGLPGVEADLTLGYDIRRGPYLALDGGLVYRAALGPRLNLPVSLEMLEIGLRPDGAGLVLSGGLDVTAAIGPLGARMEGLGATYDIDLTDLAALLNAAPAFSPPSGIALSLDLSPMRGGGMISPDHEEGRYAGALQFVAGDLELAAFGVIETHLPDGADGFSMLLFVSGQFAPVQLGFGFTLLGVGGLLGVHRDVDPDALFAAVRAGTAGDLLAPEDPVRDAPRLIALAEGIFPSSRGQYVFGPTVKLGWGTPTMMSLDLALAATLPEPLRLMLIGRLKGTIPTPVAPILRINLDLAGLLDLSGRRLELEGILFDSAIQAIPVEGGFALRSSWGPERALIFSIGGLHPGFEAPPRFPDLPRMGTTLTKGSMLRLTLGGYFAITSNTFQIGAAVDLRVSAAGFTLLGGLGFDALVEFDPFRMVVDVRARVQVMKGRRSITKLTFRGKLSGPNPWYARGKVVVEIPILPDVTVGASATFGRETAVPSKPVDVLALVTKAIASAEAWRPAGPPTGLVLAPGAEGRIDPRGALRLRQEVAPLDQPWEHFYGKPIEDATRTAVVGISVAGTPLVLGDPTEAAFPPAAFRRLTEAQRLAAPAFDDQTAGVEVDPSALTTGGDTALKDDARETVVHGPEAQRTLAEGAGPAGVALEAPPASPPVVRVRPERWRAADAEGRPIGPPTSWSAASLGPHAPVLAAEAA